MNDNKRREMLLRRQAKKEYLWKEEYGELLGELTDKEYRLQKRLAKKSLRRKDMEEELLESRKRFSDIVVKYQLRLGNMALLVKDVSRNMDWMEPEELLLCFLILVCDADGEYGFMRTHPDSQRTEAIDTYLTFRKRSRKLQKNIEKLKKMEQESEELFQLKPVEIAETASEEMAEELFRILERYYPDKGMKQEIMKDNLLYIVGMAEENPQIKKAAAVFYFRVMIMHHQRIEKRENFHFSYPKLWSYQRYHIENDNGKNYKEYRRYMELFCELLMLCKRQYGGQFSSRLNKYIFTSSSNLFYWILEDRELEKKPLMETMPVYFYQHKLSILKINPLQCDPCFLFQVQEKEQKRWELEEEKAIWLAEGFASWMRSCTGDITVEEFLTEFEDAYAINGRKIKEILLHALSGILQKQKEKGKERIWNQKERKFMLVSIFGEYVYYADWLMEQRLCRIAEKLMNFSGGGAGNCKIA